MKRGLTVCLGLSVALAVASALAQPAAGPDAVQQGRAEFDAGRDALKQGDLQAALAHFRKSLALNRSAGTLLNLASVEEKIGMFASAWTHYDEALRLLPETDKRAALAKDRLKDIQPRISTLRVQLDSGAAPDTSVSFDGKGMSAAELAGDVRADPGSHVLAIHAPGREEKRYDLTLKAGERQTIVVPPLLAPRPEPPAPSATPTAATAAPTAAPAPLAPTTAPPPSPPRRPPPALPAPESGDALRMTGFVVLGVGGAAAIAGAVTGGLSLGKKQELDNACAGSGPRTCDAALEATHASGETLAHASTATFVLAGVGLATGATLVIVSLRKGPEKTSAQLALGAGSLAVRGRF